MSFNSKKSVNLGSDAEQRRKKAQRAIIEHRTRLGIIDENCKRPYPVTAVGTPQEIEALREKWGIG